MTLGDPSPGCATQSLPTRPCFVYSPPPLCTFGVNIRSVSFSGQGSLNSRWRDCVPGSVGFEGTRGQAFKVMRLTFSAEPRFTQGTMVLSSVRLLGRERKHICTSLLPAT